MLGLLGSLLGIIPGLESLASNLLTAHFDAQVKMYMARTGAERAIAVAAVGAQANALGSLASTPVGQIIYFLFSAPCAIYTAKVIFWDKVLQLGTTDPIDGTVGWVYLTIVSFWFIGVLRQIVLR